MRLPAGLTPTRGGGGGRRGGGAREVCKVRGLVHEWLKSMAYEVDMTTWVRLDFCVLPDRLCAG